MPQVTPCYRYINKEQCLLALISFSLKSYLLLSILNFIKLPWVNFHNLPTSPTFLILVNKRFVLPGEHTAPATSLWEQSLFPNPFWPHSDNALSSPVHRTLSIHIFLFPSPKAAALGAVRALWNPSWRQTTSASFKSHSSPHTVPHVPLKNTSTRPWYVLLPPPTNRTMK